MKRIKKKWICWECKQSFKTKRELMQHRKETKHKIFEPKKLICECGKVFETVDSYAGHCSHCEKHLGHKPTWKSPFAQGKGNNKTKEGGWNCPFCEKNFRTRKELREHKIDKHLDKMHNGSAWNKGLTKETDERIAKGGQTYSNNHGLGLHKDMTGNNNPSKRPEVRERISKSMKKAHAEGRAHNIGECRWNNEPSYPEKWFMTMIKNELNMNLDIDYKREVPFHKFSLDFLFKGKKVIEIDGDYHDKDPEQQRRDKEKDKLLKEEGYKELRIKWKDIYNNTKYYIDIIKTFITT